MLDLTIAKLRLKEKNLNLTIVKGSKIIFETRSHGINGLLQAIKIFDKKLVASSVADKIVGRAAALLCAYSEIASVFAVKMSEEGRKVLENSGIFYQFENLVPNIFNYKGNDICPFEKLTTGVTNPREAYEKLQSVIRR